MLHNVERYLFIVFLLIGIVCVPVAAEQNMIKNPGFESGMANWGIAFGGEGTETAIDDEIVYSGERAFFARSEDIKQRVGAVQNVSVSEPGRYHLRAFFRAENIVKQAEDHGVLIRVQFQTQESKLVKGSEFIIGDVSVEGEWTLLEDYIDVPDGTQRLRIEFFLWYAKGAVWWDDIVLKRVDEYIDTEDDAPADRVDFITNGSFADELNKWNIWIPQGEPTITLDDTVFRSAPGSVRIDAFEHGDRAALTQSVSIKPEAWYTMSAWVKTEDVSAPLARFRVQFNSKQQHSIKTRSHLMSDGLRGTNDWTLLEETFFVPAETATLSIELFLDGAAGTVWWDDVKLIPTDPPTSSVEKVTADVLSSGTVRLQWVPPDQLEFSSYRIYRSVTPNIDVDAHTPVGTSDEPHFIDRNTQAGRTYYYVIVPLHTDGKVGNPSEHVQAVVQTVGGVQAAAALYAEPEGDGVKLSWHLPDEARARQIRLERAMIVDDSVVWVPIGMSPGWVTEHIDTTIPDNTSFDEIRYRLSVVSPEGEISQPMEAPITGIIPRRPRSVPVGVHPSLFITAEEIELIKEKAENNPGIQALLQSDVIQQGRSVALVYMTRDNVSLPAKGNNSAHSTLARQARQAALSYAFTGEPTQAEAAKKILLAYAENYKNYPLNIAYDGRVTTQTLNESPWLIDLVWAYDLLLGDDVFSDDERTLIEEDLLWNAVDVIKRYQRGLSNWQAWHNAAIGAVAFVLHDQEWIDTVLSGPQSFTVHIRDGLRDDGLWWEQAIGYHDYTVRALVFLAEAAYRNGYDLYHYTSRGKSLKQAFDAPIYHAFSDGNHPVVGNTSPSSRLGFDWTYGLGMLRYGDVRYQWLWQKGGSTGSGGIPAALFLGLRDEQVREDTTMNIGMGHFASGGVNIAGHTLLADTGMTVMRSTGASAYGPEAALLFKPHGTTVGHQAPDNLTIMLQGLGGRWLSGPGSFDYNRSEQGTWYKHTVARNGVVVDETSQYPQEAGTDIFVSDKGRSSSGQLVHFVALPSVALSTGATDRVYNDVAMERTVLVTSDYVIDRYTVASPTERQFDWVIHVAADERDISLQEENRSGPLGEQAGYEHITNVRTATTDETWHAVWSKSGNKAMHLTMLGGEPTEVIRAQGLGPSLAKQPMLLARRHAKATQFVSVFQLDAVEAAVGDVVEYEADGWQGIDVHRPTGEGVVTDRYIWAQNDGAPNEYSSITGKRFSGAAAFMRGSHTDGDGATIVLHGTELAAGEWQLTTAQPIDLAAEWSRDGSVIVAQYGDKPYTVSFAFNDAHADGLHVYRIEGDDEMLQFVQAHPVADVEVVHDTATMRWTAAPSTLYVVASVPPDDEWLKRFVKNF